MTEYVCPSCGSPAGERAFCGGCGRNLQQAKRLKSRAAWERHRRREARLGGRRLLVLVCLVLALGGSATAALAVRRHIDRVRVPSESMEPTIHLGETVSVNRDAYTVHPPAIGDIVAFHPPSGAVTNECVQPPPEGQMCAGATGGPWSVRFIKRVVAGPGDRVAMRHGRLIRNGKPVKETYTSPCGGGAGCDLPREIVIAAGQYLMLGDNRGVSDDSRFWGPVPGKWIVGRVDRCRSAGESCTPRR